MKKIFEELKPLVNKIKETPLSTLFGYLIEASLLNNSRLEKLEAKEAEIRGIKIPENVVADALVYGRKNDEETFNDFFKWMVNKYKNGFIIDNWSDGMIDVRSHLDEKWKKGSDNSTVKPDIQGGEEAIKFLDQIRDYEHESGNPIWLDERSSKELYDIFKGTGKQPQPSEDPFIQREANIFNDASTSIPSKVNYDIPNIIESEAELKTEGEDSKITHKDYIFMCDGYEKEIAHIRQRMEQAEKLVDYWHKRHEEDTAYGRQQSQRQEKEIAELKEKNKKQDDMLFEMAASGDEDSYDKSFLERQNASLKEQLAEKWPSHADIRQKYETLCDRDTSNFQDVLDLLEWLRTRNEPKNEEI